MVDVTTAPWDDPVFSEAVTPKPHDAFAGLNTDQTEVAQKLMDWFELPKPESFDPDYAFFVFRGYAGTGKTHTLKSVTPMFKGQVHLTAPTNKAAKTLSTMTGVAAGTIYSFLGLRMVEEDDKLVLSRDPNTSAQSARRGDLVIIDEASMVNRQLLEYVIELAEEMGLRFLFVGDPAQLPPVGEKRSRVWRVTDNPDNHGFLTHVERFKNQILPLSERVRQARIDKEWDASILHNDNDGPEARSGVYVTRSEDKFTASFLREPSVDKYRNVRLLAWRNAVVDHFNGLVRNALGYEEDYVVGEILMVASPVHMEIAGRQVILFHTDDEVEILEVALVTAAVRQPESNTNVRVDCYQMLVRDTTNATRQYLLRVPLKPVLLDKALSAWASAAGRARGQSRKEYWSEFWSLKKSFHSVRYSYAMTVHRAQGSTLETVYLHLGDVLSNSDLTTSLACAYVGVTRPSKCLVAFT